MKIGIAFDEGMANDGDNPSRHSRRPFDWTLAPNSHLGSAAIMHSSPDPSCPRCASTNVALFSDRLIYALADLTRERPVAKIMVFKCPCGLAFTHEEKVREEVAVV